MSNVIGIKPNSPFTAMHKKSAVPLFNTGKLLASFSVIDMSPLGHAVSVSRKSGNYNPRSILKILERGAIVHPTKRQRNYFRIVLGVNLLSNKAIIIPPRPFFDKAYELFKAHNREIACYKVGYSVIFPNV